MIAIIPAAGLGTRLHPLTFSKPKALVEVEGEALLGHAIDALVHFGVDKIFIVIGYMAEAIVDYLKSRKKETRVPIVWVYQPVPLGLLDAIKRCLDQISDDFFIYCPDNIFTRSKDLEEASQCLSEKVPIVQAVSLTPDREPNRSRWNVYELSRVQQNVFSAVSLNSCFNQSLTSGWLYPVGVTFFSKNLKPFFFKVSQYSEFSDWLREAIFQKGGIFFVLKGKRYDFSNVGQLISYQHLKEGFLQQNDSKGVSALLINREGEFLLQLRDSFSHVSYPGLWGLFGGTVEVGEDPWDAVQRELQEELGYTSQAVSLFREFIHRGKREYAYVAVLDKRIDELKLTEGRAMNFFEPKQIEHLSLRTDDEMTLRFFLEGKQDEG